MKVYFWRSNNERILRCRRGKNHYRSLAIPPNVDVCEYTPLVNSFLELIDQNMVIGTVEITSTIPHTVMLKSTDNLERLVEESERLIDAESSSEESVDEQISDESPEQDEDPLQSMVHESIDHAAAISGTVKVQVSPVAERNDGHDCLGECGPEGSPDGLHSSDDGLDISCDRPREEVDSVSSSDKDSGGN